MPDPLQYQVFRIAASVLSAILLALLALSRTASFRSHPASKMFFLYALGSVGFLISNLLENSATSPEWNLFWSRSIYLFIPFIPILWLDFASRISMAGKKLSRGTLTLLLVVPVLTVVFVFSDPLMFLIWSRIEYFQMDGYVLSRRVHGPWWGAYTAYTYIVCFAGIVISTKAFTLSRAYYRRRYLWLLAGVLLPTAASVLFVLHPIPWLLKDYTPIGYGLSVLCFFVALHRLDTFTVVPFAREILVERMGEGILVFDGDLRVVDANAAALRMLGVGENLVGHRVVPLDDLDLDTGDLDVAFSPHSIVRLPNVIVDAASKGVSSVYEREDGPLLCRYSVESWEVKESRGGRTGRLVILRDETEVRNRLAHMEELARMDSLTGIANRRGFREAASSIMASALRYHEDVSVAMFDLDGFKGVNDKHGHAAGDDVLVALAKLLAKDLRGADIAGRLGGEEFALILGRTALPGALVVCERILHDFRSMVFQDPRGASFSCTVSAGLVSCLGAEDSLENLLEKADVALYRAKAAGRDCVVRWSAD